MTRILIVFRYLMALVCLAACGVAQAQTGVWSSANHMTSSTISAIAQDRNGYIWVGTEYGLNRYDGYRYTYYLADADNPCSINDNCITTLFVDQDGTLWVGTRVGLNRYDEDSDQFTSIHFDIECQPRIQNLFVAFDGKLICATSGYGLWNVSNGVPELLTRNDVSDDSDYYQTVAVDPKGRMWKSDQFGAVECLSLQGNTQVVEASCQTQLGDVLQILPHTVDSTFILCQYGLICYDGVSFATLANTRNRMKFSSALRRSDGRIVLGTESNGIWFYTYEASQPLAPMDCSLDAIDLAQANVSALFEDRNGNLWAGCYQRGLLIQPSEVPSYMSWSFSAHQLPTSGEVTSLVHVPEQSLLVTLSDHGLYELVPGHPARRIEGLRDATCVYRDRRNQYWVTTDDQLFSFDLANGRFSQVLNVPAGNVRKVVSDKQGRLYLSTYGQGLCVYDPTSRQSWQYDMDHALNGDDKDHLCNNWVCDLMSDSRGNVWCATASGISCFDPRTHTFCPYGWSELLLNHMCQCLAEDAAGNILIGTHDGLYAYDIRTRQIDEVPLPGLRLMSRSICGIVAMPDHTVWLSTSRGIWLYDQNSGELLPYAHAEGPVNHEYNPGVAVGMPDGWVIFGQHDGFVAFDPKELRNADLTLAPLVLTAFVLGNDVMKPGDLSGGEPIFSGSVTKAHEFSLSHADNSFALEFSPLTFDAQYHPHIQYAIDNGRWNDVSDQENFIRFSHLQPGEYHITVREVYHGQTSEERSYVVRIRPPWYASWWAYLLYSLLMLCFVGLCFVVWLRHRRTQIEDEKMQLLIDATHDIRTPLTLILSPLHQLSERYQSDGDTTRKLQTIDHNARRILTLVNQILDVRRYDKQQMPFHPQMNDLCRFVQNNMQGFAYEAQQRRVSLSFRAEVESPFNVAFDRVQFEKVIVNLLGNALKFTLDGGEIEVCLTREGRNAVLRFIDTGVGLPGGETEQIFRRFYQGSTSEGGEGTGIGLNLCMKVMQLHQGSISASARPDGRRGSVFTVTLPLDVKYEMETAPESVAEPVRTTPEPAQTVVVSSPSPEVDMTVDVVNTKTVVEIPQFLVEHPVNRQPSRSQRILLVDDDAEITEYIANEMAGRYRFESCRNGLQALQLLLADPMRYDVLVSDVLMPEMDGLTLLRSVKGNNLIAHIPVILLTSKNDISNRLEGLSAGADAYIAKPFVIDELRATIDSLIANTLRHRSKFGGGLDAAKAASARELDPLQQVNDASDNKLLERIVTVVNTHLSDVDFGVDELCHEVGISRSQLHRKMKELTGNGAGEFVRNLRLEQAARMLKETGMNVSQVAYAVGFSNLGHFSKIFRTHFGVYPSEYERK